MLMVKCDHFQLTKLGMNMSTGKGVPPPLCQGFLKKRKDKMRLRWVTYWFRLYNTTLFFYTKKHGSALDLRGQYYIYEVQSVREVNRSENNRYLFEITMKNGKKKMLAADTADVRQEWMDQLWKAMLLNGPDRSGSVSNGLGSWCQITTLKLSLAGVKNQILRPAAHQWTADVSPLVKNHSSPSLMLMRHKKVCIQTMKWSKVLRSLY
ncbi:uncharacterized protein LOC125275522 [Megalobrama amblycephala]|uniref:uncharacterized protein LOC125275522 n=1 Tax=Megalobrama amblycephala TaxID=75352 RepID=UPI002013F9B1|nr:uncharacterized protein LOC125275522 [Megalobrama amblycephala]